MKFNFKHRLVEIAIVSTILFSPFFQSCGEGEDPLPNPELPVVVDPTEDDDLYVITDTAVINLKASSVAFDITDYDKDGTTIGERDAPIITTEGMNFLCTADAEKAIGEVTITLSFECPLNIMGPDEFRNAKVEIAFNAFGNHFFTQGDFFTADELWASGDDTEKLSKHTAVDEITIANEFYSPVNPFTKQIPTLICLNQELSARQYEDGFPYYQKDIAKVYQEIFGTESNLFFKENGFFITVKDENGNERQIADAYNINFGNNVMAPLDQSYSIMAKFLIETTEAFKLGRQPDYRTVKYQSQNTSADPSEPIYIGLSLQ